MLRRNVYLLSGKTYRATWRTNKVKRAIVKRDCLFKQRIENPDEVITLSYKKSINKVTKLIRQEKKKTVFVSVVKIRPRNRSENL